MQCTHWLGFQINQFTGRSTQTLPKYFEAHPVRTATDIWCNAEAHVSLCVLFWSCAGQYYIIWFRLRVRQCLQLAAYCAKLQLPQQETGLFSWHRIPWDTTEAHEVVEARPWIYLSSTGTMYINKQSLTWAHTALQAVHVYGVTVQHDASVYVYDATV